MKPALEFVEYFKISKRTGHSGPILNYVVTKIIHFTFLKQKCHNLLKIKSQVLSLK